MCRVRRWLFVSGITEKPPKQPQRGDLSMSDGGAASGGGGGEQTAEDIEMLRQILENLLLFSFDQESLMNTFERIDIDNNK